METLLSDHTAELRWLFQAFDRVRIATYLALFLLSLGILNYIRSSEQHFFMFGFNILVSTPTGLYRHHYKSVRSTSNLVNPILYLLTLVQPPFIVHWQDQTVSTHHQIKSTPVTVNSHVCT